MSDEGFDIEPRALGATLPLPVAAPLVEVRDACVGDLADLVAGVWDLPLLQRYGITEPGLRCNLEGALDGSEGLVVAVHEGEPVGFAWFLERGAFALGGYLRLIAIKPGHQRLRLGGLLLDEVERRVAERARAMFLFVSDFNVDAQRFYQRRGYQYAGTLLALVRPDIDEYVYWKRLH
jgi:ribosomal protein S18 acetylase RimI-like enzyme